MDLMNIPKVITHKRAGKIIIIAILLGLLGITSWTAVQAQTPARVQQFSGALAAGEIDIYRLSGLKQGQTLYVLMQATSGDLDPLAAMLSGDSDIRAIEKTYSTEIEKLISGNGDIAASVNLLRDRTFLVWDDDSGGGYDASFSFNIPADGDYILGAGSSLSALGRATSGGYRLLIGLDSPQVLSDQAEPGGEPFAIYDASLSGAGHAVQALEGTLSQQKPTISYNLLDFKSGDVLYATIQTTSADPIPVLILRDFGGKPLTAANLKAETTFASLQYAFTNEGSGYYLEIRPAAGQPTLGDFKLLVGRNAPEVLNGDADTSGLPVIQAAIPVQIGVKLQQIVQVNQSDEFFTAVVSVRMEWTDPTLSFSPASCQCNSKVYAENDFNKFLNDVKGQWPDFSFYNQQGNRWVQNRAVVMRPDGSVIYFERFTTNFQVDFDFSQFPFDRQSFLIRADMLYPEELYVFTDLPGFSEISPEHGEDEFIIQNFNTQVTTVPGSTNRLVSRYTFQFEAPRHLNYYVFQILIPIGLISLISYMIFFLKDFQRRIEAAAGNVLLFIAFSFSLSDNYPRLGYITFLDAIMAIALIVNTLVVVYNVYLKVLENRDESERAERIDRWMDYIYPFFFLSCILIAVLIFF
jgi:hypothetical protein